jgi:hypothetical protein
VRDKQRQIDAIRRFGADVDRSELKGKCDLVSPADGAELQIR